MTNFVNISDLNDHSEATSIFWDIFFSSLRVKYARSRGVEANEMLEDGKFA